MKTDKNESLTRGPLMFFPDRLDWSNISRSIRTGLKPVTERRAMKKIGRPIISGKAQHSDDEM